MKKNKLSQISKSTNKGIFIVLEGIDRCGKSTQQKLLGKSIVKGVNMDFPNPITYSWPLIDSYLNGKLPLSPKQAHLLFSFNRQETEEVIKSTLNSGANIICSRYIHSGIAYSMANGLDYEWCKTVDSLTKTSGDGGLPKPDVVFFIDTDPIKCSQRKGYGKQVTEKVEYQKKVRKNFISILGGTENCIVIDGNAKEKEIHREILNHLIKIINRKGISNRVNINK